MKKVLILFTALASLTACMQGANYPIDRGGNIMDRRAELDAHRGVLEIRGLCLSACTMKLGHPQACTFPNTKFGFHGVYNGSKNVSDLVGHYYSERLPVQLRAWWRQNAAHLPSSQHEYIMGEELIQRNIVPACGVK